MSASVYMAEYWPLFLIAAIALFALASWMAKCLAANGREKMRRRLLRYDLYAGEVIRRAPGKRAQLAMLDAFVHAYGIESLPPAISWFVRDLDAENPRNFYILSFPRWRYATKTGARDRRRNGNGIQCKVSVLYADRLIFTAPSPVAMIRLVNALRAHGCEIELNLLEKRKLERMRAAWGRRVSMHTVQGIVAAFEAEPTRFEQFCARLFRAMGFFVEVTPKTNDGGYDLFMRRNGTTYIAECKCYQPDTPIGRPLLQKLVGANAIKQADVMMFITTSRFSKTAIEYGRQFHMHLIDGDQLIALMNRYMPSTLRAAQMPKPEMIALTQADLAPHYPPDITPV